MKRSHSALVVLLSLYGSDRTSRAGDDTVIAHTARIDGVDIHYLTAGHGEPLVLLHGYTQTSEAWRGVIPALARRFRVIAPDLPGIGDSSIPSDGLDMTSAAARIHALVRSLQIVRASVVGHDIGLMVAYAYAAQFPSEVRKLALMDAFLPGIGAWQSYYYNPKRWHLFFNGPTPEALVAGRERIYFDHFWNDFAADPKHALSETDRQRYTAAYARPGRMRAAWAYFAALPRTAEEFARLSQTTKLTMPVLSIAGDHGAAGSLGQAVALVSSDVTVVVLRATGHWLLEERPQETLAALEKFL